MQINFADYDLECFMVKEGVFCGIPAKLILPNHIGTKFSATNKIFRSSVWDLEGNGLSFSYKKFVNWGENPGAFPVPVSIDGHTAINKIDGSACIIDYVNGMISTRTRGTFSTATIENTTDFTYCLEKYPAVTEWLKANSNYTLITEITTPNLRIVLRYGNEPELWLTGVVNKDDYTLVSQNRVDSLAKELGLKRPERYVFDNIPRMIADVSGWTDKEGICLYSPDGQSIWKIKASDYLARHRLKEEFRNIENVVDFFIREGCPDFKEFNEKVVEVVDWETAQQIIGDISRICDAWREVEKIVAGMRVFVEFDLRPLSTRKEQALKIMQSYGNTNRSQLLFKLLDSKKLDNDDRKKLLWQLLKK